MKFPTGYTLVPDYREKLDKEETFSSKLERLINHAIVDLSLNISMQELKQLIEKYLYFCFNQNKEAVLSLLQGRKIDIKKFTQNEEEINLINEFLDWKNTEKDKLVYTVVSYGYTYCSLTVKKNELLSNRLFRGKRFILDANIIFRLAGINNDERMETIKSFVKKCKEVGVELIYTAETFEELRRVIKSKVKWIEAVTGKQEPIDLSQYDYMQNDFYEIYIDWTQKKGNRYDDFLSFQKYLTNIIMNVIDSLKMEDIDNYELKKPREFNDLYLSLLKYKENHGVRRQSAKSIKTDVGNYLYVKDCRNKGKQSDLWSTRDFFISADQNFIGWSSELDKGMPVIVLPSVWLTIMLRFAGRTADDYKAFCSFLELRTHITERSFDMFELLISLSEKTDNVVLKKQILLEVLENKDSYFDDVEDNYEIVTEKAWDKVNKEEKEKNDQEIALWKEKLKAVQTDKESYELQKQVDDDFKIRKLVEKDCTNRFKIIDIINQKNG